MAEYEIHYSAVRQRKGLLPYAVMEVVDAGFSRGISQHPTREEAEAALAKLQEGPRK